ncbi:MULTISPECIES: hypothetical protein [unclassified Lysobacter]|uniref:hypothetical protein n=1 Tax=unclassified Lysobacter TaxID=2635362 RepID=UPI001BEBAA80|nr:MULTISPECIES: hypothetical protein [unclassified Lysobacter]MBT2747190.1 hypothetical protein [Lysobacter sp. ISL-42]MBT2750306.1 hypothetical protein [Lysobacter sp. ISL-50]MBT2777728.1 hypothetical protein [Lysobacter sp. ISL-54]MBT2783664.1 hypothetical protein [Lysobacter sp. ISL-52]
MDAAVANIGWNIRKSMRKKTIAIAHAASEFELFSIARVAGACERGHIDAGEAMMSRDCANAAGCCSPRRDTHATDRYAVTDAIR